MFLQVDVFGGILNDKNTNNIKKNEIINNNDKVYFNSYVHMFIMISGVSAMIMSLIGCCTSKVPDRCCVSVFTIFSTVTLTLFSLFALIMIALNLKNHDFVKTYCKRESVIGLEAPNEGDLVGNFLINVAQNAESLLF